MCYGARKWVNDVTVAFFHKQGENETPAPSLFNMKANAKWYAWKAHQGMPRTAAMRAYCLLLRKVVPSEGRVVVRSLAHSENCCRFLPCANACTHVVC